LGHDDAAGDFVKLININFAFLNQTGNGPAVEFQSIAFLKSTE
jgi:hypothetical protein